MKVLHVISSLRTGGAERLLTEIVPFLKSLGIDVDILSFDGTETSFRRQLEKDNIRIIDFGADCNVYNPLLIFRIVRIIQEYEIIHTHLSSPQYFTAIANLFVGKKLITTEHSTSNRRRDKRLFRYIERWMYRQYDSIITITKGAESRLKEYLGNESFPIITINNGINVNKFRRAIPLSDFEIQTDKTIITMVGAFRHPKDQKTLINAFTHLDRSRFELWLVGDGVKRCEIESYVRELGMAASVRFWGNREDVPSILKSSDIVVLSSIWEGFGLAAVEGMAAGKPVIASNVDGLAQVVQEAGLLFPVGDDARLAELIKRLADDPALYKTIAMRCSERATHFTINEMIKGYLEIYKNCLYENHSYSN